MALGRMAVPNTFLPLRAADLERTTRALEHATQLPGRAFTDPAVYEWERANVFARDWICAGHVDQVAERGRYVHVEAGGESVLVVGGEDGVPRAFVNACRHRGARLVDDEAGTLHRLQCPYHAWSYGFD